ncbi:hypothetical protein E2C01_003281 [Portunus trituberculatus]|uniref:Secreted protein n=1 Tax=Portunus trituberculatus TaxID=210409 RepID=A0A5B7CLT0_PORTR|nr:hypothetical protein [Portunus trituberculatus]
MTLARTRVVALLAVITMVMMVLMSQFGSQESRGSCLPESPTHSPYLQYLFIKCTLPPYYMYDTQRIKMSYLFNTHSHAHMVAR